MIESEVANVEGVATAPSSVDTAAPAEKKPVRRRTKKAEAAAESPEASASAEGAAEAAPKPRRTRAKKAEAVEAPAAEQAAAPVEEAPKPRRTRTRKVAVDDAAAAGDAAQAAPEAPAAAHAAPAQAEVPAESAPVQAAPAEGGEAPRQRRTRARAKKAEAAEAPAADSAKPAAETPAAEQAAPAAEKPAAQDTPAREAAAEGEAKPEGEKQQDARPYKQRDRRERNRDRENRSNDNRDRNNKQSNGQNQKQNGQTNKQGTGKQNSREDRFQRRDRKQRQNREVVPSVTREGLAELKVADLRAKAVELELDVTGLKKAELVDAVYDASMKAEGFIEVSGVLDILADGYGFLRATGYLPGEGDAYVGTATIRRNGLRKGDLVVGQTRPARENEKFAAIQKVILVNGVPIEELGARPRFADLTPVYPDDRLLMEHGRTTTTARVIDLCAPIGKGQRGLIVSPPKAGKTTVLKDIAASITANNPEVHLMCLLVDERPEEVTDMERSIKGEVISSTFDMPSDNHIAVAELVIERAKRLVEMGKDVVILLDSITRLARAYNLAQPASGRILSGGVDSTALYPPKRFLGAARNIEGGGSLTILASALIDTGSKMDEVIFEEFKGTGNMELKLDRNLADRRIFPAIDPVASGTRKEELLLDPQEAPLIWAVRRILSNMNNTERAMDMLIKSLKQTDTNQEFLIRTAKKAQTQHGKSDESFEF